MRALISLAVVIGLGLVAGRARAQATVLDTFGPSNGVGAGASLITGGNVFAVRFTTPLGVSTVVDRVDLSIGVTGSVPGATIAVWADSGGVPSGMPISTQAVTSPLFPVPAVVSQTFSTSATLAPATNYWVGVQTPTMGMNGVSWSTGQTSAPLALFNGITWSQSMGSAPAVRVVVRNAPEPVCAPTQGVDTIGNAGFLGSGAVGLSSSVVTAWRLTVPAGPARPVLNVQVPLAAVGQVNSASIQIWNANAAGTLPTGQPIRTQAITSPIGSTLALVSTDLASLPALPPGNYFVGVRASTAPTGFLIWGAAPTGAAQVPTSLDGGQTWTLASNPNPPAVRVNLGCPAVACAYGPIFDLFGAGDSYSTTGVVSGTSVPAIQFQVPADGVPRLAWLVDTALQVSQPGVNVTLNIWPDVAGLPSSNPIITASAPIQTTTPQIVQWIVNAPSQQIPLTPGGLYWVGLTAMGPGTVTFFRGGLPVFTTTATRSPGGAWSINASNNDTFAVRVLAECADFGACCNPRGGGCTLLSRSDCAGVGGVFAAGFPCLGLDCSARTTGACCRGTMCTVGTPAQCMGGVYLGAGTSCTPVRAGGPNVCCAPDFDNSGAANIDDIFLFLNAWFARCP